MSPFRFKGRGKATSGQICEHMCVYLICGMTSRKDITTNMVGKYDVRKLPVASGTLSRSDFPAGKASMNVSLQEESNRSFLFQLPLKERVQGIIFLFVVRTEEAND